MNFANNITIVIVSHKSKKKLTNLIKDISINIKIIIPPFFGVVTVGQ